MSETRAERLLQAAHDASEEGAEAVLAALSELTDNLADAEAATDLANILSDNVLPARRNRQPFKRNIHPSRSGRVSDARRRGRDGSGP